MLIFPSFFNAAAGGYEIEQSLRFNSADSANLSRTPSSTGNRKTFTVSCWVKRAQVGATQMIWSAGPASGGNIYLYFTSTDELQLSVDTEASGIIKTTQKFRDPSAWYHIVCAVDTSQATATNRVKFFVNGQVVSSFASASYPSQNHDTHWNHTSGHRIGQRNDGTAFYLNGYIAEFYNLDGTAVSDAQDFAEADDNGVWVPKTFVPTITPPYPENAGAPWSSGWSANTLNPTQSFDNDLGTACSVASAGTATWTGNIPAASSIRVRAALGAAASQVGSATNRVVINGVDYTQAMKNSGFLTTQGYITIPGNALTSITIVRGGGITNPSISAIEIDGQIAVDGDTGYGQNGFYLPFDPTATNGIGHDHSGNGNHWTANGFSTGTVDYAATGADPSSKILGGSYQDFWDGNTSTGIIIGQGAYVQMTSTSLPVATSTVGFYTGNGASTAYLRINGTEEFSATSTTIQWWDFSFSGTINKVEIGYLGGSGSSNTFSAFRIDGTTIVGTPGKDLDVLSDTPTTNWCTLNPLITHSGTAGSYEEGNLRRRNSTDYFFAPGFSSIAVTSGKWYFECTGDTSVYVQLGFVDAAQIASVSAGAGFINPTRGWCYQSNGVVRGNNSNYYDGTPVTASTSGDIIGCAVDFDSGSAEWYVNGTQTGATLDFSSHLATGRTWHLGVAVTNEGTDVVDVNFGQRAFAYTPPTGFKPLNTSNLPAPTVKDGSDYFNTVLYTGNGTTDHAITGVGFQPDFVWGKRRDGAFSHGLFDSIRGGDKRLVSNLTDAEDTLSEYVKSFDTDGFTLGNDANLNFNNASMVAWNWLAGNGTSINTAGSITSTVSVNPSAGFSIVSYTGTLANATVGHGLGVAPSMIICKQRTGAANDWGVYHASLGNGKFLKLNTTDAQITASTIWNNTSPTSTVFSLGTSNIGNNSAPTIAYCFAEVEGYSKFGSYTGNGNLDGVFNYCGFKPAWLLVKRTNTAANWHLVDSTRSPYNLTNTIVLPDLSDPETTYTNGGVDLLSNGFKIRSTGGAFNTSGHNYIFAAFASSPFGGDGVSPATAR